MGDPLAHLDAAFVTVCVCVCVCVFWTKGDTFSDGYVGSDNGEGRSEVRQELRIAEFPKSIEI